MARHPAAPRKSPASAAPSRAAGGGRKPSARSHQRSTLTCRSRGSRSRPASETRPSSTSPAASAAASPSRRREASARWLCASRDGRRRRRPALADRRQHARAQVPAVEAQRLVHRIFVPGKAVARPRMRRSSARSTPSSGRSCQPCPRRARAGIAARPATPAPRSSWIRTVSSWSSRWWAVSRRSPAASSAASAA